MWKLLQVTGSRSEFSLHPKNYYQKMASSLGPEKKLSIYVAYKKKTPLAAILVINHNKTATYLHGASANIFRNWMAPHLLQWEAIQDACQNNLQYYDFWGVDSEKWPGVTRFKKGFNGTEAVFHPTYDLPLYPIAYQIYQKLYRWLS
jgi:lipid II:glycine glycyltransferase (peptidoglycan interpeptide bridge formation enzyme)